MGQSSLGGYRESQFCERAVVRASSSKDILVNCCCRSFHYWCCFGASSVWVLFWSG